MSEAEGGGGGEAKTVPYERFAAVVAERKMLQGDVERLTVEAASGKTAGAAAAAHEAAAKEWQAKHDALDGKFSRYRDLSGAGITDPEVAELAEWTYGRMPEKDRPTFGDALKQWKAKPDEAPATLRPFLGAAQDPGTGGAGGGAPAPGTRTVAQPQPGAGQFSNDAIGRMSTDEYRKHRAAINGKSTAGA